mgnify:CR=1 FL=1
MNPVLVAILLGILQGILEWIPVSSEGGVALASTVLGGFAPADATRLALFLHAGTAVAAVAYYREDVAALWRSAPGQFRDAPATEPELRVVRRATDRTLDRPLPGRFGVVRAFG